MALLENSQAEILEQFTLLAKKTRGRATSDLFLKALAEPGLFGFSELLDLKQLSEPDQSSSLELLQLFAFGTWKIYRNSDKFPVLSDAQALKLRQLTVLSLAENSKVLEYDLLMEELGIQNVRELEDLLINECMYTGIIRGRLDQKRRCLEVHFSACRDLKPGRLDQQIAALSHWMGTCESLMERIGEKIEWAEWHGRVQAEEKKSMEDKMEEMIKLMQTEISLQNNQIETEFAEAGGGLVDVFNDKTARSRTKRRK